METFVLEKILNNTELGKGNTHETYLQLSRNLDITSFMRVSKNTADSIEFVCCQTKRVYNFRLVQVPNGEYRIVGMGPYFRDTMLNAGDKIFLIKQVKDGKISYWVNNYRCKNGVVFKKESNGYILLNMNREQLNCHGNMLLKNNSRLEIVFKEAKRKRADSPVLTDYYHIKIDGINLPDNFAKNNEMIVIRKINEHYCLYIPNICSFHHFSREDV